MPSTRSRPSRSRGRDGTSASPSARRPGPATSSCASRTRSSSGATSRSARSPWTSPGPSGSHSSVPTGRARRRSSRRCSAASRSPPGTRRLGPSVVIGELAQDRRILGDGPNLADAFTAATGLPRDQARSQLAKFGLGADAVLRPSSSLSPGERTRAELAAFAALGVNFLVLDEPTNHLDLPAIEQLESALQQLRRDAAAGLTRPATAGDGHHHAPRGNAGTQRPGARTTRGLNEGAARRRCIPQPDDGAGRRRPAAPRRQPRSAARSPLLAHSPSEGLASPAGADDDGGVPCTTGQR